MLTGRGAAAGARVPALLAAALGALLLGGCRAAYPEGPPPDFELTFRREACFGTCPVYALTLSADGRLVFRGERFVLAQGLQEATLPPDQVEAVYRAVVDASFFDLSERYEVRATDLPSADLTVTLDGRTWSVRHYGLACGSDLDRAPEGLCRLEAVVEAMPVRSGWVASR